MNANRDFNALMDFLDYLKDKGLMKPATAQSRKASANKVLSILSEAELQDVTTLDIDDVTSRFANIQGKNYNPTSLRTYKSRVSAAVDDFSKYLADPMGFRPANQSRASRSKKSTGDSTSQSQDNDQHNTAKIRDRARATPPTTAQVIHTSVSNVNILPIPLRENLTIKIQGIPFDLTLAEANKLAAVIKAMAKIE